MRPRFRLPVPLRPEEVVERLVEQLKQPDQPCQGLVSHEHRVVELRMPEVDQHVWSPALNIAVEPDEHEDGSVIRGIIGPNSNIWTLFAMLYMGLLVMISFAGLFGLVQLSLGLSPWGLTVTLALALALLLVYTLSRIGQGLAAPQTVVLRHFLEETLEVPESERSVTDRDPYHDRPARPPASP